MTRLVTAEEVRSALDYDPATGIFRWRLPHAKSRVIAGTIAGRICVKGYIRLTLCQRIYAAHRLAWLYVTGDWPVNEIDHKNGDRQDNRFDNLRDVTRKLNAQNLHRNSNKNGLAGVHWTTRNKKYRATIRVDGKAVFLGMFDQPEPAHQAYIEAKRRYHEGSTL